jgi:hypothetical protein
LVAACGFFFFFFSLRIQIMGAYKLTTSRVVNVRVHGRNILPFFFPFILAANMSV